MLQQVQPIPFFRLRRRTVFGMDRILAVPLFSGSKYTEFYCDPVNGSDLNSGSDQNATARYTTNAGNWVGAATRTFTVTDGSNPGQFIQVGDFVSIYLTSAPVMYSARVASVDNVANGNVVVTANFVGVSVPANGTGTMTLKAGGAFKGPNGANNSVLGGLLTSGTNIAGDPPRLNMRNNATYSITASMNLFCGAGAVIQGYTNTPGDGGKAKLETTVASVTLTCASNGGGIYCIDIEFSNTASTGAVDMVALGGNCSLNRCIFHGATAAGASTGASNQGMFFRECEFYNNNKSLGANRGALNIGSGGPLIVYVQGCIFHDNLNCDAFRDNGGINGTRIIQNNIFDSNGAAGIRLGTALSAYTATVVANNDFYGNVGEAINCGSSLVYIDNNNFFKNGRGILMTAATLFGWMYNNAWGSGSMANGATDFLGDYQNLNPFIFPPGLTPWANPATGDWRIVSPYAINAGRGNFTETAASGKSGTIGYPDIGAAAALASVVGAKGGAGGG